MFGGGTVQGIVVRLVTGGGKAGPVGSAAVVIVAQNIDVPNSMVLATRLVMIFIAGRIPVTAVFRRRCGRPSAAC